MFNKDNFSKKQGLVKIIVPFRGYGRHSLNQVVIENEGLAEKVLLSNAQMSALSFDKIVLQKMKTYMKYIKFNPI